MAWFKSALKRSVISPGIRLKAWNTPPVHMHLHRNASAREAQCVVAVVVEEKIDSAGGEERWRHVRKVECARGCEIGGLLCI